MLLFNNMITADGEGQDETYLIFIPISPLSAVMKEEHWGREEGREAERKGKNRKREREGERKQEDKRLLL